MEVMIKRKNVVFDSQILSTLMSCGRLTEFRFGKHLQPIGGKSPSLEMGSIVHAYLEHYYGSIIRGVDTKKVAHEYGMAAAENYAKSDECKNSTNDERALALNTCELYREHYINDSWTPLEVETVKQEVLYSDDSIRILWKAKLDLIVDTNSRVMPVDHKTMKQRRDTLTLNNQFIGQCILMKSRTVMVNKIGFQKSLPPKDRFTRVLLNYTLDALQEWQEEILPYWAYEFINYQENGYFPPNYTHCENKYGFCAFKNVCSNSRNLRENILGQEFIVGEAWDI